LILFLAERGYRMFIRRHPGLSFADLKLKLTATEATPIDLTDVKPIEQILSGPDIRKTSLHKFKVLWPVIALFAVILACAGTYQSIKIARLQTTGLRAPGEVVRLHEEYSSGDSGGQRNYFAVVKFQSEKNVPVEFKDSLGSNPPSYRRGDKVTVLYLADNPKQEAIIDRGFWGNWAIPAIIFLAAAFVTWLLVVMLRAGSFQKTAIHEQPSV
jgi:hypothetical protein